MESANLTFQSLDYHSATWATIIICWWRALQAIFFFQYYQNSRAKTNKWKDKKNKPKTLASTRCEETNWWKAGCVWIWLFWIDFYDHSPKWWVNTLDSLQTSFFFNSFWLRLVFQYVPRKTGIQFSTCLPTFYQWWLQHNLLNWPSVNLTKAK